MEDVADAATESGTRSRRWETLSDGGSLREIEAGSRGMDFLRRDAVRLEAVEVVLWVELESAPGLDDEDDFVGLMG